VEPKKGIDAFDRDHNGTVTKRENEEGGKLCKNWFRDSTLILGFDKFGQRNNGWAEWKFNLPRKIRKKLVSIDLKIVTIRTHGKLHTPPYDIRKPPLRTAHIKVNDKELDDIDLVSRMPGETDFGVMVKDYPIKDYIVDNDEQTVRLEVPKEVSWDIDEIKMEPIIRNKRWRTWFTIFLGIVLGGIFSYFLPLIATFIISLLYFLHC